MVVAIFRRYSALGSSISWFHELLPKSGLLYDFALMLQVPADLRQWREHSPWEATSTFCFVKIEANVKKIVC